MKQINIPPIRIPEFRMPSLGLSTIGLPADRSGNRAAWPSGLKDSIVCWYSPRKQGLTEYDVIESYAEDFITWDKFPNRGTVTVTQNTIIITESKELYNVIEDKQEPYSDLTINVTGVSDDLFLIVSDNTGRKGEIKKDGIYTFKNNSRYFGFKTNAVGECNIKITQLPTSKAKDFSANGHDLFLYKFKGKLDSGIGLYLYDFTSDLRINSVYLSYTDIQANSICSLSGHVFGWLFQFKDPNINIAPLKIKVKGIVNDIFEYWGYDENGIRFYFKINKDGVYELPASYVVETNNGVGIKCLTDCVDNVCFTQIPDYPNQLCYNGSSYGVAYGLPILSDYTIIADRTWFENNGDRVFANKGNIWPNCAFTFEKINVSLNSETFSFSQSTRIDDLRNKSGITYQTKQSYNGNPISFGDSSDGEVLVIGGQITGEFVGCHGDILLFNRTLTDDEITWLKENWEKL